jgi:hypothetical protein
VPLLVHIAPENAANKIRRNGIATSRIRGEMRGQNRFVWCFPVLPSYTLTHQWSRELKRWGRTTLVSVTFRVPDDELVLARHYLHEPQPMSAAEATGRIAGMDDPRGLEILIPRRIVPSEIVRVRILPEAVGWRYAPNFKNAGRYPCDCPVCVPRGEVKARRYRERIPLMQARWESKNGR